MSNPETENNQDVLYYTDGIISNPNTLSILTMLFNRVFTFYLDVDYYEPNLSPALKKLSDPSAFNSKKYIEETGNYWDDKILDGVHPELAASQLKKSMSIFWNRNKLLRKEGVLQPIGVSQSPPDFTNTKDYFETLLKSGLWKYARIGQTRGLLPSGKPYLDSGLFFVHRMNQACGGLWFANRHSLLPIADNSELASLASGMQKYADTDKFLSPSMSQKASMIAIQTAMCLLPNLRISEPEDILEVRQRLRDERNEFSQAMTRLSYEIPDDAQLDDVQHHITKIISTEVKPALDTIKVRLQNQKDKLFRSICTDIIAAEAGVPLVTQCISMQTGIVTGLTMLAKGLIDFHEYQSNKNMIIKDPSGYGLNFIIELDKLSKSKSIKQTGSFGILPEVYEVQ